MSTRKIERFNRELSKLPARWRKVPPVRVDWHKPPPRKTLPILRYAINPSKTMILKVMVFRATPEELVEPANPRKPYFISVALFRIDGEFMFDYQLTLDAAEYALSLLRRLFTDEWVIRVIEKDGVWGGSGFGPATDSINSRERKFTYLRSWNGTRDRDFRQGRAGSRSPNPSSDEPKRLRKAR